MEEPRPLEFLHYIKVDDMDPVLSLKGLSYGMVQGEVGELHEGADNIQEPEGRGDLTTVQGHGKGGVDTLARAHEGAETASEK